MLRRDSKRGKNYRTHRAIVLVQKTRIKTILLIERGIILFGQVNNGNSIIAGRVFAENSKVLETLDTDIEKEKGTTLELVCFLFFGHKKY